VLEYLNSNRCPRFDDQTSIPSNRDESRNGDNHRLGW
jgi:hypothetical protein